MVRINRSDVIQKAVNDLGISTSGEKIPNETLDKVQLTYDLNKKFSTFILSGSQSTTGQISVTLPTVSAGGEIYLTGLNVSYIKDATCDIATSVSALALNVTPDASNVSISIFRPTTITLTAQSSDVSIALPYPLKLKVGTTVTMSGTFSAGVLARSVSIIGFTTSSN